MIRLAATIVAWFPTVCPLRRIVVADHGRTPRGLRIGTPPKLCASDGLQLRDMAALFESRDISMR